MKKLKTLDDTKDPNNVDFVEIFWFDAANHPGWVQFDQFKNLTVHWIKTRGYTVKEDKHSITITHSVSEMACVPDPMSIPKKMMFSIKKLNV